MKACDNKNLTIEITGGKKYSEPFDKHGLTFIWECAKCHLANGMYLGQKGPLSTDQLTGFIKQWIAEHHTYESQTTSDTGTSQA